MNVKRETTGTPEETNFTGKEGNNLKPKGKQSKLASQETSKMLRETKLVRWMRNLILGSGPKSTPGTAMSTDARRSTELCPL